MEMHGIYIHKLYPILHLGSTHFTVCRADLYFLFFWRGEGWGSRYIAQAGLELLTQAIFLSASRGPVHTVQASTVLT
jgi:hypothetical protein